MKLFDPHIHMTSRTTDDLEAWRPEKKKLASQSGSGSPMSSATICCQVRNRPLSVKT